MTLSVDKSTIISSETAALNLPSGNISQRPPTASNGMIRYNTETYCVEVAINGNWSPLQLTGTLNRLWGFGYRAFGAGDNSLTGSLSSSTPNQVGGLTDWKQVAGALALKTNGTMWQYDYNMRGPIQVGTMNDWQHIESKSGVYAAIKTDGTLWTWGVNNYGALGLGDRTSRSTPVQVVSLTSWKQVSPSDYFTTAVKTDGTLWVWGAPTSWQPAWGNTPVQIGRLTNWQQVAGGFFHTMAVKTDGTLWGWGDNSTAALGLGDFSNRSSPVQVGSLTNWRQVAAGDYHTAAINTNGELWTWGMNSYGQLGVGVTNVTYWRPVRVNSNTAWKLVACGSYHTAAIKTNGTLWTWGQNYSGQLGLGDYSLRSQPLQVNARTDWDSVCAEGSSTAGITKSTL